MLCDEFGGFEAVASQLHAVAVLFEHATDKLANADGIVGDDDDAFVLHAVDGFARNRASGYGCGTWREDSGGAGVRLERAAFIWFRRNDAIQIDQQNQAAVGSNSCAGEKFYAAQIFTEAFDNDFVLAEDFFDDQADLAIVHISDDHAEIAVDGLKRRQTEMGVETNDFGDDVADFGEQLSADVFDFVGANAADFLDNGQRQSKVGGSAAHEKRWGDDQCQRNFQYKLCALAGRAVNFDFAIERIQIGADYVESDSTAGEFRFRRGGGEAGMENHLAQIAFSKAVGGFGRDESAFD